MRWCYLFAAIKNQDQTIRYHKFGCSWNLRSIQDKRWMTILIGWYASYSIFFVLIMIGFFLLFFLFCSVLFCELVSILLLCLTAKFQTNQTKNVRCFWYCYVEFFFSSFQQMQRRWEQKKMKSLGDTNSSQNFCRFAGIFVMTIFAMGTQLINILFPMK